METDEQLLRRVRAGDEAAFVALVGRYHGSLVRVARCYVPSEAVAEEAAQETWIGVVRGLEHFEGRSSFKTWLFRILVKRARTTGVHEHRHLPIDDVERAVDPARFTDNGAWAEPPQPWEDDVDERVMAANWTKRLDHALHELPPRQRDVVLLHDVEQLRGDEVCVVLGISEANRRVLLHRGRSRLRTMLEDELESKEQW